MTIPSFTLVTSNPGKQAQYRRLMPGGVTYEFLNVELTEIQGSARDIVTHSLKEAFEKLGSPVMLEDAGAGLDMHGGLPGPYVKHYLKALGENALYTLAGQQDSPGHVACTIGYFDGTNLLISEAVVKGTIVSARGDNGFGFDGVFVPEGHTKTFAEMTNQEKDALSHRALALTGLLKQLEEL